MGEEEAGQRLYQVIVDPRCTKSGVYWSWNGGPREGRSCCLHISLSFTIVHGMYVYVCKCDFFMPQVAVSMR